MNNTTKSIIAFAAGTAVGAALGILFAPEKGEELRKKIADTAKDQLRKAKENFECKKENSDNTAGEEA